MLTFAFVGTQGTFLAYGVTCVLVFVGYFVLIFFYVSKQPLPPPPEDTGHTAESVYLAPHGVPGGIPRSPSKAKGTDHSISDMVYLKGRATMTTQTVAPTP